MRVRLIQFFLAGWLSVAGSVTAQAKSFQLHGVTVELTEVTVEVDVYYRSMRFNRAAGTWNVEVLLSNKSSQVFSGPLIYYVAGFANTSGPLQPDGLDGAQPFFDVSATVGDGALSPSELSQPYTLSLGVTSGSPSLTNRIYARGPPAAGAALAVTRTLNEAGQLLPSVSITEMGSLGQTNLHSDPFFGVVTLGQTAGNHVWRFSAPDHLPVWRTQNLTTGAVQIVAHPRLTRRNANAVSLTPLGGGVVTNTDSTVQVQFAPGTVLAGTTATLTPLTGQTLPALLPLGWSPLQSFWLEMSPAPLAAATAVFNFSSPITPGDSVALVRWDEINLQWNAVQVLSGTGHSLTSSVAASGAYALVVGDTIPTTPPAPQLGQALLPVVAPLPNATNLLASGTVNPATSAASRTPELVTAQAEVVLTNRAGPLPSGVLLHSDVSDSYRLNDNSTRFPPRYDNFIVGYQRPGDINPATLHAQFPLRPLLLFGPDELTEATVHVDVLAPGAFTGSVLEPDGGQVAREGLRLLSGLGDFDRAHAAQLRRLSPTNFAELVDTNFVVLDAFELAVDGLNTGRSLRVQLAGAPTNALFVLGRVRMEKGLYGIEPRERLISDARGNLTTLEPVTGERLPGLTSAGQYVLLQAHDRQALIAGLARNASGQAVGGLAIRSFPWLTLSAANGAYQLLSPTGTVRVTTLDLVSGDTGQASVVVTNPLTTAIAGLSTVAVGPQVISITPTNGATRVSRVTPVVMRFSKPINPGSAINGLHLLGSNGVPIAATLTLNLANTELRLLPVNPLEPSTLHTIAVSTNIADLSGRNLEGAARFAFVTESDFLNRSGAELTVFPSTNGLTRVVGSAGAAEPGVPVLLLNEVTAATVTVLSRPDGSFESFIEGNLDDVISAVIVNANGSRSVVPLTRRILPDGGEMLFASGGIVRAQGELGEVQVIIDPGVISGASVFRLDALSSNQVQRLAGNVPPRGAKLLGQGFALSINGDRLLASPHVSVPVNLADIELAPGERPEDANFALVAISRVGGSIGYCLVDSMRYENGRLVTSSPPFPGPNYESGGLQSLQQLLAERGITLNALATAISTNETAAYFAGELGQISMLAADTNRLVANELEKNFPNGFPAVKTAAEFVQFVGQFDPRVRLALDLFTISYAPIQIAKSRKVTVTGKALACVLDANGNCDETLVRPVAGAVVTLRQLTANLSFLPGRIDEGFIYSLTDREGRYALIADNTALPLNTTTVFGFLVSATHPRFFGQRPIEGVELSPVINTYRHDLYFADEDFNQPTKIPPFIAINHSPAFPGTNETAVVTIRATQGASRPTIDKPIVVAVIPLNPEGDAQLSDVTIMGPTETQDVGDRTRVEKFELRTTNAVSVILAVQAYTGASGIRQVGYELTFGAGAPPPSGTLVNPDPEDDQPPAVARTVPPQDGFIGPTDSMLIEFNEPIDPSVLSQSGLVQLNPPAGTPLFSLSADQRQLQIRFPQLQGGSSYTLTLQSGIKDLAGLGLDPAAPTSKLAFRTSPELMGTLAGIENGGGVVIRGGYAFALDRGSSPALVSYDLTNPTKPSEAQRIKFGMTFRDLVLVSDYSFVKKPGDPVETRTLLALIGGEFTAFFDELGNQSFGGQYLRIYDVSDPKDMKRIAARRISAAPGAATKIRWSPPLLSYLSSTSDAQEIGLVNLQQFIIGANLPPADFDQLPFDPVEGVDANNDGDFVDSGDTLPLPGRLSGEFAGKTASFSLDDTTQRIQDFSFDNQAGYLGVVLGSGRLVTLSGGLGAELKPSYRTLVAQGQIIPRQDRDKVSFVFPTGRPKRLFNLFNVTLVTTNGSTTGDFALVSLVPEGSASTNAIVVLDITDTLNVLVLGEIPIPIGDGLVQSIHALPGGLLAVATSEHVLILDSTKLLLPADASGAHPAVVRRINGAGSGSFTTAATEFGLFASNLGGRQTIVQTAPFVAIVSSVDTNSLINAEPMGDDNQEAQDAFNKVRVADSLLPGRFRAVTNDGVVIVNSTLSPPQPLLHYYALVLAPGAAGKEITLALESLNAGGSALRNKGAGFPPVSAMHPTTRQTIGQAFRANCDNDGEPLTAYRFSDDPMSHLYNAYLSKPFALTYEGYTQTELDNLRSQPVREVLWSGHFTRVSIDPEMSGNLAIGSFASEKDGSAGVIHPLAAAVVESLPADYITGPNPPPVEGTAEVPGTFGTISAHNGEFRMEVEDFALPSRRMPIRFGRHIGGQDLYDGVFGRGWDFKFNERLVELRGGVFLPGMKIPIVVRGNGQDEIGNINDVFWQTGEGRTITYSFAGTTPPPRYQNDQLLDELGWLDDAKGFYLPPPGIFDALLRFDDGRFVRVQPDGTQTWYSPRGRLEKIQDRYDDNVIVCEYNTRGELSRIRDDSVTVDRYLDLGYYRKSGSDFEPGKPDKVAPNDASVGRVCTLKDYTDREIDFGYDDCGRLVNRQGVNISFAHPLGFTGRELTTYDYGNNYTGANDVRGVTEGTQTASPVFKATSVVEKNGVPVVQQGDGAEGTYGVSLQHGNSAKDVAAGNAKTDITKPDSSKYQMEFHPDSRPKKLESTGSGAGPAAVQFDYTTNGLVKKVTYPEQNTVTYRYDEGATVALRSLPNVRGIKRDPGTRPGDPIPEATFEYDDKFNFPDGSHQDFNGNNITYGAASAGKDVGSITYPGAGTVTMEYNSHGQLESQESIDGVKSSMSYDPAKGFLTSDKTGDLETVYAYPGNSGKRGMPNTVTPPEGAAFSRTYNERDELITETRSGTGYLRELSYDVNGNMVRHKSAVDTDAHLIERREYKQNGFLEKIVLEQVETDGGSQDLTTIFEPDSMFRVKKISYPGGLQFRTYEQFDHLGRPRKMTLGNYSEEYTYDLNGNLRTVKRGSVGDTATDTSTFDGYDRLTKLEVENGSTPETTDRTYFGNGELKTLVIRDSQQQVNLDQAFEVDSFGRNTKIITKTTDQGDVLTRIAYNQSARTVTTTDPENEVTTITLNAAGQRTSETDSIRTLNYDYGNLLNLRSITATENGRNFLQQFTPYNSLNQAQAFTDSMGKVVDLVPRIDGAIKSTRNARNHTTSFGRSKLGEALDRTREDGMQFNFTYHPHRALASAKDASSQGHSYAYDTSFRMDETTFRDGSKSTVSDFDVRNNQSKAMSIPGGNLTLTRDAKGRLTGRTVNFLGTLRQETMDYDALDRVTKATFPQGQRTFIYDRLGPLRDSQLTFGGIQYNLKAEIRRDGSRTALQYPSAGGGSPGIKLTEGRDQAGRLTGVSPDNGTAIVSQMVYDSSDRVGLHLLGSTNSAIQCNSFFDARKRLTARRYTFQSSGKLLADVRYAYDPADNVVARQYLHRAGRADFFKYDNGERLERADYGVRPNISSQQNRNLSGFAQPAEVTGGWAAGFYGRDFNFQPGNLDFLFSANPVNPDNLPLPAFTTNFIGFGLFLEVLNTDGFARARDNLGNIRRARLYVRPLTGAGPVAVGANLVYNGLSQLVRVDRDDGVTVAYEYQHDGLCCYRSEQGPSIPGGIRETVFVYHGPLLVAEYDRTGGGNTLKARYYYAESDVPVAADIADGGGNLRRYYLLQENNGSVMGIADEAGNVVERYFYDAYGQPEIQLPDQQPPVVDQITTVPGGLLVQFSETILPAPSAASPPGMASALTPLASALNLAVNGVTVSASFQYEDSSPAGFGRTVRLAFSTNGLGANAVLNISADTLLDEWNNPVPAQPVVFTLNLAPGATNFVRAARTRTDFDPVSRSSVGNPFLFHGQLFEYDTGLVYMRARHYDPAIGQFLQTDPAGYQDSVNLFAGMGCNPLSYTDPTGRAKGKSWWSRFGDFLMGRKTQGSQPRVHAPSAASSPTPASGIARPARRNIVEINNGTHLRRDSNPRRRAMSASSSPSGAADDAMAPALGATFPARRPSPEELLRIEAEGRRVIDELESWSVQEQMLGRLVVDDHSSQLGGMQMILGPHGPEFVGTLGGRSPGRGRVHSVVEINRALRGSDFLDRVHRATFIHELSHARSAAKFGQKNISERGTPRLIEEFSAHMDGLRAEVALFGVNAQWKSPLRRAFERSGDRGVLEHMLPSYRQDFGVNTVEEMLRMFRFTSLR